MDTTCIKMRVGFLIAMFVVAVALALSITAAATESWMILIVTNSTYTIEYEEGLSKFRVCVEPVGQGTEDRICDSGDTKSGMQYYLLLL